MNDDETEQTAGVCNTIEISLVFNNTIEIYTVNDHGHTFLYAYLL